MSEEQWTAVDDYICDKLVREDVTLQATRQACEDADLPAISVTPPQGRFLSLLVRSIGARRILELGTLGGYSTIWLARALPVGGSLVTLELDPQRAAIARANVERARCADRVELREGPALESLAQLATEGGPPFDFIFLDADKEHHAEYFAAALDLARPGALIVADNVVRGGAVLDSATDDPDLQGIRRLFDLLADEPRVEVSALQTVGSKGHDGFAIALVNASPPPSPARQGAPSSKPTGN